MKNSEIYFVKMILFLGLFFVFSFPLQLIAQEQMKTEKLLEDEIEDEFKWLREEANATVVIATKTEKKVEDAPGSVTVISREMLKRRDIKTVDEALSELAGVFVKRNKGLMDGNPSVMLRGFNDNLYTLVLLDGQPLNNGYSGILSWNALPVENIEKIEISRGAASALYGGNAMGGVINIITRTPEKLEISASAGYGTHNTKRYRFTAGNRFMDKFSMNIGCEGEITDGYETRMVLRTIKPGAGTESGGVPMNDKYGNPTKWVVGDGGKNSAERSAFNFKAGFDFSDTGSLAFTAVSGRHEYDYDPPNTYMGTFSGTAIAGPDSKAGFSPNDFISTGIGDEEMSVHTLGFKEQFGHIYIEAQAGVSKTDERYITESGGSKKTYYDSPGNLTEIETETWFSEFHTDIPIGENHMLTMGASYRTDDSDTNNYDVPYYRSYSDKSAGTFHSGGKDEIWSVFFQDEWNIAETFTIFTGGRYDSWKVRDGVSGEAGSESEYESNTDSEFSPRAAVVWKAFSNTIFRGSVSHAFRPPNLYELYRTRTMRGTLYQSNPNLEPETVWTYEAGTDQYLFNKNTRLSLTAYRNDIEDLIYYKHDQDAKTKTRMNAGKAEIYGLEFEASQQIYTWMKLWGNMTYADAKITENPLDPGSEDKDITGIPKTAWNIGLDAQHRLFRGSLVGRYYSKIYTDSENRDTEDGVYTTNEPAFYLDAKITFTPFKWAELSLSADNIFDKEYYQYYRQTGRTFLFELNFRY